MGGDLIEQAATLVPLIREALASGKTVTFAIKHIVPREDHLDAIAEEKEQEKEGFSIPAQLKLLKEYAATNGFAIAQEYVDVETAKQTGRQKPPSPRRSLWRVTRRNRPKLRFGCPSWTLIEPCASHRGLNLETSWNAFHQCG
jgi:hypothetical protein